MQYAIPEVGSEIEFISHTPNPGQPFALPNRYQGTVVQSFKWAGDHDFCITTGDRTFPVRIVDIRYVREMKHINSSTVPTQAELTAVPKILSWTTEGSKGDVYIVTNDDGKWACDCVAGQFGRHCKHVEKIKRECV